MEDSHMKLMITQKQLDELSSEQKQNLCDLWIPNLYDTAVATVCVDAAEETYGQITFVIGGVTILKNYNLLLYDLKYLPEQKIRIIQDNNSESVDSDNIDQYNEIENKETHETNLNEDDEEDDIEEDFSFDEDFSFEFQRPESFLKQECLPLLNIGQMLDILSRKNFGQCNFSLSVAIEEDYIEIGKENFVQDNNFNEDSENVELCDVLWKAVKTLL